MLALDVGSHSVKLVAARHTAAGVCIAAAARAEVPAGALYGHLVRDPAAVGDVIRRLVRRTVGRARTAVTAVPGPAIMMRSCVVPAGAGPECDAAVVQQAAGFVPDALDRVVLDYHVLGPAGGGVSVLLVVARRELVLSYTAALRAAGLEPRLVDVDVFALDRLHRTACGAAGVTAPVALLHTGARAVLVTLVADDGPVCAGDVALGPRLDADAIASGVDRAIALSSTGPRPRLGGVVLSGGAAHSPGLAPALAARLGCPVAVVDAFAAVRPGPGLDHGLGPACAVAVGMALRRPGAS